MGVYFVTQTVLHHRLPKYLLLCNSHGLKQTLLLLFLEYLNKEMVFAPQATLNSNFIWQLINPVPLPISLCLSPCPNGITA